MTNTNDIQQARDVLARRRASTTAKRGVGLPVTAAPDDAALIQLVVNPDVLDVLDSMLAEAAADIAAWGQNPTGLWNDELRLAAAIIAADERMSA